MPKKERDPEAVEAGQRLRVTRIALGYASIRSLANAFDENENNLSKYETGEAMVSKRVVQKLKDRHGVTFDWINGGDPKGLPFELAMKVQSAITEEQA